jgi:putative CocE/NonD family hydrolase
MGENEWTTFEDFPPAASVQTDYFLGSLKGANSLAGDGSLSIAVIEEASTDNFVYDPMQPVPTYGGANFHMMHETMGIRDRREIEGRDDVLVYTSEVMDRDMDIVGQVMLELYASTEGKDTDFTATLVEVRPDGYARIICEGIQRLSFRNSNSEKDLVTPGEIVQFNIDLGRTAIEIGEGSRIRLEISSSSFPKYDRNPNTGEDPFAAKEFKTVEQTIYHGNQYPSRLVLPVLEPGVQEKSSLH